MQIAAEGQKPPRMQHSRVDGPAPAAQETQPTRPLLAKGVLVGCTFTVEDCHTAFKELSARG